MTTDSLFDLSELGLSDDDLIQEHIVQSLVKSAGGSIAGRIRIQKIVFLLDKMGLGSGFDYSYHHYGPYAARLSDAIDFAKAFNLISEEFEHRKSDGARYSIFKIKEKIRSNPRSDFFENKKILNALTKMNNSNSTVLELAATIYWLQNDEKVDDWRSEIIKRKGSKTESGRLERAESLLNEIGLN